MAKGKRMLALICIICPLCSVVRRWPNSVFARKFRRYEKNCPACKAYWEIYGRRRG